MEKLTPRQSQVLQLIKTHIEDTGFPPTRANIANEFGFRSANAAEDHLRALERKGAIEMVPGTSRGIRLVETETGIPIIGRVAAGEPILAEQHIEGYCPVALNTFKPSANYFLTVKGDSMINIGIHDGDLLAVHQTTEAHNGQIVVARVGDDQATVKRYQRSGRKVRLLPENTDYEPLEIDLKHQTLTIEGLGVGLLRNQLG